MRVKNPGGKMNREIIDIDIMRDINDDDKLKHQLDNLSNFKMFRGARVVGMPDIHPGKFFPVGIVVECDPYTNGIMPGVIGNDIGCGISYVKFKPGKRGLDFFKLDKFINENIPSGINSTHDNDRICNTQEYEDAIYQIKCMHCHVSYSHKHLSFGTLGSGNHFIEIGKGEDNAYYLFVHTGSRSVGAEVYTYYLNLVRDNDSHPWELGILTDEDHIFNYILDTNMCTWYAHFNRKAIINRILKGMKWKAESDIESFSHNFIEVIGDKVIIRKGATGCTADIGRLIPVASNARDGMFLVKLPEFGYRRSLNSLPHGSGRKLARGEVSDKFTVNDYKKWLENIHCTTINSNNLDEAPFAYRSDFDLLRNLEDYGLGTVKNKIRPLYNYKPKE